MAELVVMVLDNPDQLGDVLQAWREAGAPGVTILNSTGLQRVSEGGLREDLPLMPSLAQVLKGEMAEHRTLFALIEDEAVRDRLIAATRALIAFEEPHSGLLFVIPVSQHWGTQEQGTRDRQ